MLGNQSRLMEGQGQMLQQLVTLAKDHHEILTHHTEIFQGHTQLLHTIADRLGRIENQLEKMADYEDRIKALEQAVFRKGA